MRKIWTMAVIAILMFSAGCGSVGGILTEVESFATDDQIDLKTTRTNILDIVAEVGRSMDFKVSGISRSAGSISLTSGPSTFAVMMIGKISSADIQVAVTDNGGKIRIGVQTVGNFGSGGQKAAEELLKDFKAKLLEKLK